VTVVSPTSTPTQVASSPPLKTATASLQVFPPTARVGDTLDVILHLSGVEELYAVEAHLSLDPASVTVADALPNEEGLQLEHGDLLSPDFVIQNTISQTTSAETAVAAHYAISQMPPKKPVSGEGVLVTMHLEAVSPGALSMSVDSLILASISGRVIPVNVDTAKVSLPIQ
jgi:hypothetical protein